VIRLGEAGDPRKYYRARRGSGTFFTRVLSIRYILEEKGEKREGRARGRERRPEDVRRETEATELGVVQGDVHEDVSGLAVARSALTFLSGGKSFDLANGLYGHLERT